MRTWSAPQRPRNSDWCASSAHRRPSTRRRASRTRWRPSTSCSTPLAASGYAGPALCCAPAGDWSPWRRSRPMAASTSPSSRTATSSGRSRGSPMPGSCGARPSRSSRWRRRARRSRAAWSGAGAARWCWPSHERRPHPDRRDCDPRQCAPREATEFVSDASTRCCSTIHDECSLGCRCGSSGTFIAPAGVTSSAASPRLTLVGGPDEVKATEARCEIRVLIADGQALVRAGLRVLLEGDARITVVGEAATGEEAVAEARRVGPDVVLIDAMLPGLSCVEATALMSAESGAHVMLLTASESDERIFAALRAGARGLLLKDTEPTKLVRAVDALARGEALLAPARRLIAELASRPQPECPSPELRDELTASEREVLALVALGLSNDEIAERLVISRATAKTHVSRTMVKLHARDRAKLVVFAYEYEAGLVAARAGSGTSDLSV